MGIILQFVCSAAFCGYSGRRRLCRECWALTDNKSENPIANHKSEQRYHSIMAALS